MDTVKDGLLDVILFGGVSKFDLVGYALSGPNDLSKGDPRIQHFRVRSAEIETEPAMHVMADGVTLGEGPVRVGVQKLALTVMVPKKKNEKHKKESDAPYEQTV